MKIQSFHINNFKSLVSFDLQFADFTCLIGLNGAGKTTVLQALDFIAQLMRGRLDDWLVARDWTSADLDSKLVTKKNIDFSLYFESSTGHHFCWKGSFNRDRLYCSSEAVYRRSEADFSGGKRLFDVGDGRYRLGGSTPAQNIQFDYHGSLLSQLRDEHIATHGDSCLIELKRFLLQTRSLDLLSPHLLRQRTRGDVYDLGRGGEKLSAFLHELAQDDKDRLLALLKKAYPNLRSFDTRSLTGGWKRLEIEEQYQVVREGSLFPENLSTEAKHINDGMLRLMAIIAETITDHSLLLFDEIENGVNPELVEFLVDTLIEAPQQILVTTHSPMILNFLEDEVAKQGMQYIYKSEDGRTRSLPFFSIPSMQEKLEFMGPGEVYADTDLPALQREITALGRAS